MKSRQWKRGEVIADLKGDIWRFITQAAQPERDVLLYAARLLQMSTADLRTLAQIHFVLSDEVRALLEHMPSLVRRLATTTLAEREISAEKIRGSIRWSETYAMRAASGLPHLFVTSPTRRAFDTPENQLLTFALEAIALIGRRTGWEDSTSIGVGELVRERVTGAMKWRHARALADLQARLPSLKTIARVRAGRRRHLYGRAIAVVDLHQRLIARLDRGSIRSAVESHALVTRQDAVLLELLCAFRLMDEFERQGWQGQQAGLLSGGRIFSGKRDSERLELYYQHAPDGLRAGSRYRALQIDHGFKAGGLIPDLVISVQGTGGPPRWVLVEVKGLERSVTDSARAAAMDLLAYRRAFGPALDGQEGPYGLGIAWGAGLEPVVTSEVALCSPDTIGAAMDAVV